MNKALFSLLVMIRNLAKRETGQDLVEYALVVALIAFGAVAGMKKLATGISTAFSNVSTQLGSDIT
jgi:pilus assembly protein Flp/PilA